MKLSIWKGCDILIVF